MPRVNRVVASLATELCGTTQCATLRHQTLICLVRSLAANYAECFEDRGAIIYDILRAEPGGEDLICED